LAHGYGEEILDTKTSAAERLNGLCAPSIPCGARDTLEAWLETLGLDKLWVEARRRTDGRAALSFEFRKTSDDSSR